MSATSLVEAVSAGVGAGLATAETLRRYWRRREERQQVRFTAAVQRIVDASIGDLATRQVDFERRQGQHLDRQDRAIAELRRLVELPRRRG